MLARTMTVGTWINLHKALVIPIVLAMMAIYGNWSVEAFVYLSLHGTYSLLWLAKQTLYPDSKFAERQPFWVGFVFVFVPLAGYYMAPYLLISRYVTLPGWFIAVAIAVYILGIFLHYVSDAQKYFTLKVRKGLITDGLFARTRNPNYLGEILIYIAYAMLSLHWLPFAIEGAWILGFFWPNMRKKDASMARYPEFATYKARTGMLLPRIM
jgi:protein-S-isoprenylcysteine O-methyltransferase Ste14